MLRFAVARSAPACARFASSVKSKRGAGAPAAKVWGPPTAPPSNRLPNGCLVGEVVSTAMQKTVNVNVTRSRVIPKRGPPSLDFFLRPARRRASSP